MTSTLSNNPLVSVLVTAYNREAYVAEALESVLAQTMSDFELIVCDDCSTDRTIEIAREYERRDARIRVSVNERNLGQFENRRHAASLARGRYLKFHDSDDVMYPHCLAVMIEPLLKEPTAAFALSASQSWPGGPCPMLLTPRLAYEREFLGSGLFQLGPASALFRTDQFRALGGFPLEGVASDYLFWLSACTKVNVLLVPGDLFYYRIHPGQEMAAPHVDVQYAKAASATWAMLNSDACPLDRAGREQAKRHFMYIVARESYRYLRRRRFASAVAAVRYAGVSPVDWIRYLRPPHRSHGAGTPSVDQSRVVDRA